VQQHPTYVAASNTHGPVLCKVVASMSGLDSAGVLVCLASAAEIGAANIGGDVGLANMWFGVLPTHPQLSTWQLLVWLFYRLPHRSPACMRAWGEARWLNRECGKWGDLAACVCVNHFRGCK
jgi:hypothetical protein